MSKVSVTKIKLDYLANCIATKSGESTPLTLDEMAAAVQSIPSGGGGITISDTTDAAGGTVRTITAVAISGTKSITQNGTGIDVASYAAVDVNVSGGSPSATQHVIHFEFTDTTDTDINVYYDDPLISTMITAYSPVTYNNKQVATAALDNVIWYQPAPIPLNTQLIDFTEVKNGYTVDQDTGAEEVTQWSAVSDYTEIDPTMTFSYIGYMWYYYCYYDSSKNFIKSVYMYEDADSKANDNAYGTLTPAKIPSNAKYIRINCLENPSSSQLSLIRTA